MPKAEIKLDPDFDLDPDAEVMEMPLMAYIAGPMGTFEKSIVRAVDAARLQGMLVKQGFAVYNPYGSCHSLFCWGPVTKEQWLTNDFYFISQCDLIVLMPGWEESAGAKDELAYAMSIDQNPPDIFEVVNLDDPEATVAELREVDPAKLELFTAGGDA